MDKDTLDKQVLSQSMRAKMASRVLASLSTDDKNKVLIAMADALIKEKDEIIFKNEIDVQAAKEIKLEESLIDRLILDEKRINDMANGLREMAKLPDPIGEVLSDLDSSGVKIKKLRVPLGVVGMIYESRPNVTVDAAGLCLKAGNAVILRGGSEALNSNHALAKIIAKAGYDAGLPEGAIQFIETTDREAISELVKLDSLIDLIIPRGSEQMIRHIRQISTVPVLSHGKGLCHTYADKDADLNMAKEISINAKVQRPGVCNAMETLLVHKDIAKEFLPLVIGAFKENGVEVRGDSYTKQIVSNVKDATEEDWSTEYLSLIISIKVVNSLEDAINHINKYGSGHSDSIVTSNKSTADKFLNEVDSAAVFHNASTRLHDGGIFGMGAEIGISNQKLHTRGAMGMKDLTTTKYMVYGNGTIRK